MASGASVDINAIQRGIECCKAAIQKLEYASATLLQHYQKAGNGGWSDKSYTTLGLVFNECRKALEKPTSELHNCLSKLNLLSSSIVEYEQVSLGSVVVNSRSEVSGTHSSGPSHSPRVMACSPGEYHYESGCNNSRHAYGQLRLVAQGDRHRNQSAQSAAGDTRRCEDDDGGHLISARFGGASTSENLSPQNMHLNRSGYRALENE